MNRIQDIIRNLIRAGYSAIYCKGHEEQRVERELCGIAAGLKDSNGRPFNLYTWSLTIGLVKQHADPTKCEAVSGTEDPLAMLEKFSDLPPRSIVMAADFHSFTKQDNAMVHRRIKDAIRLGKGSNRVLVIVACQLHLPPELEKEFAVIEFPLPDRETLGVVLDAIVTNAGVAIDAVKREAALDASAGLTCQESEDAFALSVIETGGICPATISRMKAQAVKKSGILEIIETGTKFDNVGGMGEAKGWLSTMARSFSKEAKAYGLPAPKGVLCLGVQGAGKTTLAKATANLFNIPLLKMDGGKLFSREVGGSEANVRMAIQTAEAVAPCVLMIDELDKALSGSKSSNMTDGGTSARVLGTLLSWMQDKTAPVFVFATANDVTQLPPELLRKGRWDEMFFCDLPSDDERADIWRIHIEKNGRKASDYNIPTLVQQSIGWTGAEIETAYVGAMRIAFNGGHQPHEGDHLESVVKTMVPLSRTMAEDITKLREWATGRCRMASASKPQKMMVATGRKIIANN